jgi:hypothetical protein
VKIDRAKFVSGAIGIRLKNARVLARPMSDGSVFWKFKRLVGGEIIRTDIRLSREANEAMFAIYMRLIEESEG